MSIETKRALLTALEKLHGSRLRRFLSGRLGAGRSDAPDLAQEVFLRLLRVEDHEAIRNPQAYLYTIANHVLHQHALRQSATDPTRFADVITELSAAEEPDPLTELETDQRFEALAKALESYSPRAYTTLILHRCDGIPLSEIARRFGVSYSMAKRYLSQAVAFCQQQLQERE